MRRTKFYRKGVVNFLLGFSDDKILIQNNKFVERFFLFYPGVFIMKYFFRLFSSYVSQEPDWLRDGQLLHLGQGVLRGGQLLHPDQGVLRAA